MQFASGRRAGLQPARPPTPFTFIAFSSPAPSKRVPGRKPWSACPRLGLRGNGGSTAGFTTGRSGRRAAGHFFTSFPGEAAGKTSPSSLHLRFFLDAQTIMACHVRERRPSCPPACIHGRRQQQDVVSQVLTRGWPKASRTNRPPACSTRQLRHPDPAAGVRHPAAPRPPRDSSRGGGVGYSRWRERACGAQVVGADAGRIGWF